MPSADADGTIVRYQYYEEGESVFAYKRISNEISQIVASGKRGIVLEMDNRKEWEPVVQELMRTAMKGKICIEVASSLRTSGEITMFAPAFYQRKADRLLKISREELDQARPGSILAIGLEKWGNDPNVGMIFIGNYQMLDSESRAQSIQVMTRMLTSGDGPLLLLTVSHLDSLQNDLFPYMYVIRSIMPDTEEIQARIAQALGNRKLDESFLQEIESYLHGFHGYDIPYLFRRAEMLYGEAAFDEKRKGILELIGSEKVKLLEQGELLEWKMVRQVDMANMSALKNHLLESGSIMAQMESASNAGVNVPKGILILGLPGTGKSLFAQFAAAKLKMPLIRLDMGKMMGGHVGDSERNLRTAQRQAESMAPCILWIDEIEKGFAGSGGGREESAYLQRMTGSFLTWLQEKSSSCYIIATANSVDKLPPEFFRKGRFDECFSTAMPTEQEVRAILRVHLMKPGRSHVEPVAEDAINAVIRLAPGEKRFMTGADAGALVSNAFRRLFVNFGNGDPSGKQEYDLAHLVEVMESEFKRMKVFSETNGPDIARHAVIVRESNFIDASGNEQQPDSRYDGALRAFIAQEEIELKGTNKI